MDKPPCDGCMYCRPDTSQKGRSQIIYARCGNPKLTEGRTMHFCAVNRKVYGMCPGGIHFEPKPVLVVAHSGFETQYMDYMDGISYVKDTTTGGWIVKLAAIARRPIRQFDKEQV